MNSEEIVLKQDLGEVIEQVVDLHEGKLVAIKFEKHSYVRYFREKGKDVPLVEPEIPCDPELKLSAHLQDAMLFLYDFTDAIVKLKSRQLPLLRVECEQNGLKKSVMKKLEKKKLILQLNVSVNNDSVRDQKTNKPKPMGDRAVIYFTPLGRAYLKEVLGKTLWEVTSDN